MRKQRASHGRRVSVEEIVARLGAQLSAVHGPRGGTVAGPASLADAGPDDVTFCNDFDEAGRQIVAATRARLVICHPSVTLPASFGKTLLLVANPRLGFIRVVTAFFVPPRPTGIAETAVVDQDAEIGRHVFIGPHACIGRCRIGDGSIIYGHVHIYSDTEIGCNVTIHAGAVIGADGFGYERNEEGVLEKFPQIGRVIIEDDVEIGANVCIDRATLGTTVIGRGTKIDDLAYAAHNVVIGRNAVVTAHSTVCGGVRIGDGVWVAPSAAIRDKVSVGAGATVGLGSAVITDVADGETVIGVPARRIGESVGRREKE